jgi:hypothetical protein
MGATNVSLIARHTSTAIREGPFRSAPRTPSLKCADQMRVANAVQTLPAAHLRVFTIASELGERQ